jgi:hypothetical protein
MAGRRPKEKVKKEEEEAKAVEQAAQGHCC